MTQPVLLAAFLLVAAPPAWPARACEEGTVRDAAFAEPRDVHRLCVMAPAGDPSADRIYRQLDSWLKVDGTGLNLELRRVDVDDPNVNWSDYGIPSAPPSSPVVVLAGWQGAEKRAFFIDYWEPGPTPADLALLAGSPARDAIRRQVVDHAAVLLYIPAAGDGAGQAAGPAEYVVAAAVAKAWSQREGPSVSLVRLDRADQRERLLLCFAGAAKPGPDWVGVLFGRGKLMPPLVGPEITAAALDDAIGSITAYCTCLQQPSRLGVDIPMAWDASLDAAVVALRPSRDDANAPAPGLPLAASNDSSSDDSSPRLAAALLAETDDSAAKRRIMATTLWTLGAVLLISSVATVAVVRRQQRRNAAATER